MAALRAALDAAGFSSAAVRSALGAGAELLSQSFDIAVHNRRLGEAPDAHAALLRLLVLDLPVEAAAVDRALGGSAELLVRLGVASEDGDVLRAAARIVPHDDLLIASDRVTETAPEHVAGVHWPSATLSNLTVRREVATALDVGTGNGIQALVASRHAARVVATDVNERALAFAEFNAALNGVENVEFRAGSFFEPVEGERFDLVVCNPPYVISPETAHVFRDSGLPGDTVSEKLVGELPPHLGRGRVRDDHDQLDRRRRPHGAAAYVARGERLRRLDPPHRAPRIRCARRRPGTARSAAPRTKSPSGSTPGSTTTPGSASRRSPTAPSILHRRSGGDNWVRSAELSSGVLNPASGHLLQLFEAQEVLAEAPGDALLDRRLALVEAARFNRTESVVAGGGSSRRPMSASPPASASARTSTATARPSSPRSTAPSRCAGASHRLRRSSESRKPTSPRSPCSCSTTSSSTASPCRPEPRRYATNWSPLPFRFAR